MKKEIFVTTSYLETDREYTLDELKDIADKQIKGFDIVYSLNSMMKLITHYKIKAYSESDYVDLYTRFEICYYRMETDNEYEARIKKEEEYRISIELADRKKLEIKLKKEEQKRKLQEDPEYSKFLELEKKFKICTK